MTLDHDWVMVEPDVTMLAHLVPAEHRSVVLSDGRMTGVAGRECAAGGAADGLRA
ncbi:hypothetical protein [Streptomyces yerevanensis]|uniref:hypothetical protein n=1 Tax=Streptomyces yerevanensis TaxID=66378 RepID=UPI001FE03B31|nr:hypothetical protein [Streptomyces yerevanensis]